MDPAAQLDGFRAAYHTLEQRVRRAIYTHLLDPAETSGVRHLLLDYGARAEQYHHLFAAEPAELATIRSNIEKMVQDLDTAAHRFQDQPDAPRPTLAARGIGQTGPGAPRVEIDRELLAELLQSGTRASAAALLNCSSRTVRRRALEAGLAVAAPPVFIHLETDGGDILVHNPESVGRRPSSTLTDPELDAILVHILQLFSAFGRRMISGNLKYRGHKISRARVRESYVRVKGLPPSFGPRQVMRRTYRVAGPNSLSHHDGQHGLIHYGIIIHAFVDGYSRLITGIRAHDNNRAATVLALFRAVCAAHGIPSRCRGDHGVENLLVAQFMEERRGSGRGSYIWGPSVHNIRVERLWRDVTEGFGRHWKNFFIDLEVHHGFVRGNRVHRWLLHWLFLDHLNAEVQEWAGAWNAHTLSLRGQKDASPRRLWIDGEHEHGRRGISLDAAPIPREDNPLTADEARLYGIDWQDLENADILAHHHDNNEGDGAVEAAAPAPPAADPLPDRMNTVTVEGPDQPWSTTDIVRLYAYISNSAARGYSIHTHDMLVRRRMWDDALLFCATFA